MATDFKKVRNDQIPMRSGIVKVTPLDENMNPIYDKSITTDRQFLTSTQISESRTSETLPNGNQESDKEFITGARHTLSVVTQVYDPMFHAIVSGGEIIESSGTRLEDATIIPNDEGEVEFTGDDIPVASPNDPDKKIHFEIRDSYRNEFTEVTGEIQGDHEFKYDPDTHKLTFNSSMANISLSCVYHVATSSNARGYRTARILKNNVFQIEVMAEMQSASYGDVVKYYAIMPRATTTGDIPNVTTQKSISSAITYTFASAPVPTGVSSLDVWFDDEKVI